MLAVLRRFFVGGFEAVMTSREVAEVKPMGQEYGVMHCQGVAEVVVVAVLAVPVLAEDVLAVAVLAVPVLAVAVLADAMLVLAVPIVLLRTSH